MSCELIAALVLTGFGIAACLAPFAVVEDRRRERNYREWIAKQKREGPHITRPSLWARKTGMRTNDE